MKTTSKKLSLLAALIVCLGLANVRAADDTTTPRSQDNNYQQGSKDTYQTGRSTEGTPAKYNKASGIVGMEVRNQNDEHLGHIKDVVFDLRSERISYAVMTTGSKALLGINEKLLAVPLNALTASSDQKYLVLNADKAKLEAAAGFDKNNWPNVGNPSWGAEPFWQKSDRPATTPSTVPSQPPLPTTPKND